MLELDYFLAHPDKAWPVIREIFYNHFGKARPNRAHEVLAAWERDGWARATGADGAGPDGPGSRGAAAGTTGGAPPDGRGRPAASDARGYLKCLITQNIVNLHLEAGIQDILILPRLQE